MVGKWHLGMDFPGTYRKRDWKKPTRDMPLDKGFDYYWGIPASMNYGVLARLYNSRPVFLVSITSFHSPERMA